MKTSNAQRQRVNFSIKLHILKELENLVPNGQRSEFVNEALEGALIQFSRKIAFQETDALRKKLHHKFYSDEELLKEIRYGRKYE